MSELSNISINSNKLTLDQEHKLKPLINEWSEEVFDISFEDSKKSFWYDMDKSINFVAFLHRLTPDQRSKLDKFKSLNIETDIKEDISVFLKSFKERSTVNVSSKTFKQGMSALVIAEIISPRQIDYIMGN